MKTRLDVWFVFMAVVPTLGSLVYFFQPLWAQDLEPRATYTKLTWKAPTARTDAVPFDIVAENGYYELTWTRSTQTGVIKLTAPTVQYDISQFKANTQFVLRACDDLAQCSADSNVVTKPGGPPVSPTITGVP